MNDNNDISVDRFVGVECWRNRTKQFFLTGIASGVTETHIKSYLERRGINSTYISVFPSKRKGSLSAKVYILSSAFSFVQDDNFWLRLVTCKMWKSTEQLQENN